MVVSVLLRAVMQQICVLYFNGKQVFLYGVHLTALLGGRCSVLNQPIHATSDCKL